MELKNRTLSNFADLVQTGECKKFKGRLKVGVDLGTANTVLAVVDTTNRPIAGISAPSQAIRDGVIVNYYESVQLVTRLKAELEEKLKTELPYAAAAIPPGVSEGSSKSIQYVLEGAGFEVSNIVDEPTAAAAVLKISDGAVVDVGGGTTGISILKDGTEIPYTGNAAADGVLYHYACIAKEENISFKVCCRLDKLSISDTDLCCLLGNALDNAVTACGRYDGERYITVASEKNQDMLLLTVDNSFDGMILKKEEKILSRKRKDEAGIGIRSMQQICEKYNGISRFEAAESQFEASFMIHI